MQAGTYKLGVARTDDAQRRALRRIKQWTRERFSLGDNELAMVTQEDTRIPGAPPVHTLIVFQCADGLKRHYRVFKPAVEVVEDDLPPAWMKNALVTPDGYQCSCC
jgi:nitrate reductase delta subunit